jgi:hypothetical protein
LATVITLPVFIFTYHHCTLYRETLKKLLITTKLAVPISSLLKLEVEVAGAINELT